VWLALVPTDAAWKAVAWMPLLTQTGEATPSLAQLTAVSRRWEERFGARVMVVRPATVEWVVSRPPASTEEAIAAAQEHFTFTPEADDSDVLEERAEQLMHEFWYAWWD
jgi:hypothetical protein